MPYKNPEDARKYQRERRARIRNEFFSGKSCVRCGSTDELQVDHVDPSQKVTHRVWTWTPVKREAELAKCQVLCEPCHKKKTKAHHEDTRTHATRTAYRDGCRCYGCRLANSTYTREWRAFRSQMFT